MLSALNHFVDCCFRNFHGLHTGRYSAVDHRLKDHLPDFHLGNSVPESAFGVNGEFLPAV
jgi:hypothetical protein